jgi:protein CpxP
VGGLAGCGHCHPHADGGIETRVAEWRGRTVERIGERLALDATQKAKLEALADQLQALHRDLRGPASPREDWLALMAGDRFDRAGAQRWLDGRLQAAHDHGPRVLEAFADFYDSLDATQQRRLRERLERRGHPRWWGTRP